ncbi:MAG: hypothetical protein NVS2B12_18760 [Ktedonobacteraceae bacterium]
MGTEFPSNHDEKRATIQDTKSTSQQVDRNGEISSLLQEEIASTPHVCQERFALSIQGSSDGWWDRDLRTNTVYFSPRWKQLLGYSDAEFPNRLEEWIGRVHPDDLARTVLVALQRQLDGHELSYEFDHRVRHKDGTYRWLHARGSALRDEHGDVYRVACWHTDITEQKLAEEMQARRAQHASFRVDVSMALAERATLPAILQRCTQAMVHHLNAAFARIWTLTPGTTTLILRASAGKYTHLDGSHARVLLGTLKIGRIAQSRRPYLTNDVLNDPQISDQDWARQEGMISFAGYPLLVEDQVVGVMAMFSQEPLMEDTLEALDTVANAVAQGIGRKWAEEHLEERVAERTRELSLLLQENARLYGQAQELAVLQERQRLARELHDSVSQALYGVVLGTRTARVLLQRDLKQLATLLDNIHAQAELGLTEMRTLIFELRPESLENEGLVSALKKHAITVQARYGLNIELDLSEEPSLPFLVQEALYRIAQEALHNIVKHAQATTATVSLCPSTDSASITLEVSDNGIGFDPTQSFPGHLGMQSMRERLARLGGMLEISSTPGHGTRIQAVLP